MEARPSRRQYRPRRWPAAAYAAQEAATQKRRRVARHQGARLGDASPEIRPVRAPLSMKHDPKNIAAAVNGYVKALRLLGRDHTTYSEIAAALHIETVEVERAFKDYKITKASVDKARSASFNAARLEFSKVVNLSR
jgi:DNA invertase Pin-like site-specific DNA recombinase